MPITDSEVRHMAHLARLALTEEEIAVYAGQLSDILDYAGMIQGLDTDAIPPTAQVVPQRGVMRDDTVEPSMPRDEALANAPHVEQGQFKVRAILEET